MRPLPLFLVAALGLLQPALARSAECPGTSLVPQFQKDLPEVWNEALAALEALPGGTGLLWKIEKPGVQPSWLFGTMHVADAEVMRLQPEATAAFDAAQTLVIESTEVLHAASDAALLKAQLTRALLPAGETLDEGLSEKQKQALKELTAAHGIPYFAARRMQPWFLAAAVAIPPCAKLVIVKGAPVLDQKLYLDAVAAGKKVVGLESVDEQLSALSSVDSEVWTEALLEAAELGLEKLDDWHATMLDLYTDERVALAPLIIGYLPEYAATARSVEAMDETLITARNRRMRDRLLPIIEEGGAFVAVGALHLSGESGLVALLRESGYTVTRVD